jgi:hypothetical protein
MRLTRIYGLTTHAIRATFSYDIGPLNSLDSLTRD